MIISKDCDLIDTEEYECCEECYRWEICSRIEGFDYDFLKFDPETNSVTVKIDGTYQKGFQDGYEKALKDGYNKALKDLLTKVKTLLEGE